MLIIFAGLVQCGPSARFASGRQKHDHRVRGSSPRILTGIASYYADKFHGRQTANGEIFDMYQLTAAHRTLPFNTLLDVTNLSNGKKVRVRVNDRGPFVDNRIIDLSYAAAKKIGMVASGTAEVEIHIIKPGDQ